MWWTKYTSAFYCTLDTQYRIVSYDEERHVEFRLDRQTFITGVNCNFQWILYTRRPWRWDECWVVDCRRVVARVSGSRRGGRSSNRIGRGRHQWPSRVLESSAATAAVNSGQRWVDAGTPGNRITTSEPTSSPLQALLVKPPSLLQLSSYRATLVALVFRGYYSRLYYLTVCTMYISIVVKLLLRSFERWLKDNNQHYDSLKIILRRCWLQKSYEKLKKSNLRQHSTQS